VNPNDLETPEEREERMKLVQKIQKSFYVGEQEGLVVVQPDDLTVLEQVPLWRVQWTELPGYQNVLNCHVPHYTHMFHRILSGPKPWLFGHLFLPGGSENLDNPLYRLPEEPSGSIGTQATVAGTLMQVTDYRQLEDGRLALIVQALERFQLLAATQHVPYAIATIRLDPDWEPCRQQPAVAEEEDSSSSSGDLNRNVSHKKLAVRENLEWRDWEFRPTLWEEVSEDGAGGVSPLVNYNGNYFPNEMLVSSSEEGAVVKDDERIARLERDVWVALDRMLDLLAQINPGIRIPVPAQLLGLLPIMNDSVDRWSEGFQLEQYAARLQQNDASIGTSTKSPFVRISENASYPDRRRAARLSYVIWIILDSIAVRGSPSRQELLEETSIANRLAMAFTQLEAVNTALRQSLK
jgi:Lon protease-like protein